jgi:hypothetical protein
MQDAFIEQVYGSKKTNLSATRRYFAARKGAKNSRGDGDGQSRHHAGTANQELIHALFCRFAALAGCLRSRRCSGSDASAATRSAAIAL